MKTFAEVSNWCAGAEEEFGDASVPVCQVFIRWRDDLKNLSTNDLACGWVDGELVLLLGPEFQPLPMQVGLGPYQLDQDGQIESYGATPIAKGVWGIAPSLNVERSIHAFIVLYGVPDPAPWERRIIIP